MKLEHGALRDAVSEFGGSIHVVRAAWDKNRNAILEPDKYALDVRSKNGGGRPSKMTGAQVRAAVGKVPCRYRHSLRKLAEKTGIPKSTLARHLKIDNDILQRGGLPGGGGGGSSTSSNNGAGAAAGAAIYATGTDNAPGGAPSGPAAHHLQDELKETCMKRRIQEELRGHYQVEVSKAVERAKKEAEREHKKHLEELERFHEQDLEEARAGLRREFDSEKDEVLYRLRVEMHRHQLELNMLKGVMEKIGGGGGQLEEKEGELAKLGDGGRLQEKEGVQQEEGSF